MTFYGNIPAGVPDSLAIFGSLLPLEWKGVQVPYEKLENELRQDLVIHKFADRDGAHIEGTGRHPLQFTARIPFFNGLAPGPNENFPRLYPQQRDAMLAACATGTSGTLQHPELGPLTCKVSSFRWALVATQQGGTWADIVWLETDDSGDDLEDGLAHQSAAATVTSSASTLDDQLADINPAIIPKPYVPPFSFGDLAFAIRGVVDQFTLLQKSYAGRIDNFIYQCNSLEASLNLAINANALNWPIIQACEQAKSALFDMKATLLTKGKPISYYTVQKDSTLAQLCANVGADITDIMILNSGIVQLPVVPAGVQIRYYAAAA